MTRFLALLLGGCTHDRVSWPQRNVQRCLECSAIRLYRIGEQPGKWHYEAPMKAA